MTNIFFIIGRDIFEWKVSPISFAFPYFCFFFNSKIKFKNNVPLSRCDTAPLSIILIKINEK